MSTTTRFDVVELIKKVSVCKSEKETESATYECFFENRPISSEKLKSLLEKVIKPNVHAPAVPATISPDYKSTVFNDQGDDNFNWIISHEHSKQAIIEFLIRYVSMYVEEKIWPPFSGKLPHDPEINYLYIWGSLAYFWYHSKDKNDAESLFFFAYELLMKKIQREDTFTEVFHFISQQCKHQNSAFNVLLLHELCAFLKIELLQYETCTTKDSTGILDRQDSLILHSGEKQDVPPKSIDVSRSLVVISAEHVDEVRLCVRHCPDTEFCSRALEKLINKQLFWTTEGVQMEEFPGAYPFWSYRQRLEAMTRKPDNWEEQSHFYVKERKVYCSPHQDVTFDYMEKIENVVQENSYDLYKYGVKTFQLSEDDIAEFAPTFSIEYPHELAVVQSDRKKLIDQESSNGTPAPQLPFYIQTVARDNKTSPIFEQVHMQEDDVHRIRKKVLPEVGLDETTVTQLKAKYGPQVTKILMEHMEVDNASEEKNMEDEDFQNVKANDALSDSPHQNTSSSTIRSRGKRVAKPPERLTIEHTPAKKKKGFTQYTQTSDRILDLLMNVQSEVAKNQFDGMISLSVKDASAISKKIFRGLTQHHDIASKIKNTTMTDKRYHLYHIQCDSAYANKWPKRQRIASDNPLSTFLKSVNLEGIHTWMEFLALGDSLFPFHNENEWFGSINYCAGGKGKIWYVVPAHQVLEFELWLKSEMDKRGENKKKCTNFSQHKSIWIDITQIPEQFTVTAVYQRRGMFIVTAPGAMHFGVNVDENFCTAINYCSKDWTAMMFATKLCSGEDANCSLRVIFPVELVLSVLDQYCELDTQLDLEMYKRAFKQPEMNEKPVNESAEKWIQDMLTRANQGTEETVELTIKEEKMESNEVESRNLAMHEDFTTSNEDPMMLSDIDVMSYNQTLVEDTMSDLGEMFQSSPSNVIFNPGHYITFQCLKNETTSKQGEVGPTHLMVHVEAPESKSCNGVNLESNKGNEQSEQVSKKKKLQNEVRKCEVEKCGMFYKYPSGKGQHDAAWHYFYSCKLCSFIGNQHITKTHLKNVHPNQHAEIIKEVPTTHKGKENLPLERLTRRERKMKSWYDVPEEFQNDNNMKILRKKQEEGEAVETD